MNTSTPRKTLQAFTLIELLVVLGILAVLATVIFPALQASRSSANNGICVANLRQIFQITQNWALDNNGYVPQARWYVTNLSSPYINLTRYGLTQKLCVCPESGLTTLSYGINSKLVTDSPSQWGPGDVYYYDHGKYKLALLSPRSILFSETAKDSPSSKRGWYIAAPSYAAWPHKNRGNVLYADGHVESLTPTEIKNATNWTNGLP